MVKNQCGEKKFIEQEDCYIARQRDGNYKISKQMTVIIRMKIYKDTCYCVWGSAEKGRLSRACGSGVL